MRFTGFFAWCMSIFGAHSTVIYNFTCVFCINCRFGTWKNDLFRKWLAAKPQRQRILLVTLHLRQVRSIFSRGLDHEHGFAISTAKRGHRSKSSHSTWTGRFLHVGNWSGTLSFIIPQQESIVPFLCEPTMFFPACLFSFLTNWFFRSEHA